MKRIYLPFFLMLVLFACKKERTESIDYNQLTEKRILEVSEQAAIKAEDIASLERLLEKVDNTAVKTKLTAMLEGVKILKDFLPGLEKLKTDLDINFNEMYQELEAKLGQISDQLPRKAKLKQELESAKANYGKEEYEYPEWIVSTEYSLGNYLLKNYKISPVAGNKNRFLRSDIERVDSLTVPGSSANHPYIPLSVIKTFKGLRVLATVILEDGVDLNSLTKLEKLSIRWKSGLKIDALSNLKELRLEAGDWGQEMDFSNKYPLLEKLYIAGTIANKLTTVLLPNKQHLVQATFGGDAQGNNTLPQIKRLVIEAKEIKSFSLILGSESNREVNEVKLSGFGGKVDDYNYSQLILSGPNGDAFITGKTFVKVRKLDISCPALESLGIGTIDLPASLDLATTKNLRHLGVSRFTVAGREHTINDLLNLDQLRPALERFTFTDLNFPSGAFDISTFSKLTGGVVYSSDVVKQPLKKLIMTRAQYAMEDPGDGTCDNCGFYVPAEVERAIK